VIQRELQQGPNVLLSRLGFVLTLAFASASSFAGANGADTATDPSATSTPRTEPTIEEVIVTAQRREQRLQDVPISISAVSGSALDQVGDQGFKSYADRVPGLQLVSSGPTRTQIVMRGIATGGSTAENVQLRDSVGVYFDDIPVNVASSNPNFQLYDLERVEVLRGPQGTLYGAGSMSGAIRYITAKPNLSEFLWSATASGSSTSHHAGKNYNADGVLNIPSPSGNAAARVVGFYRSDDGYIDNIASGRQNSNSDEIYGGRASARIRLSERLDLTGQVMYQKISVDDSDFYLKELGYLVTSTPYPTIAVDTQKVYSLTGEYQLDPVSITSTASYRDSNDFSTVELGALPTIFFGQPPGRLITSPSPILNKGNSFTQELRVQGPGSARLKWILGAFYETAHQLGGQQVDIPGIERAAFLPPGAVFGTQTDRIFDLTDDLHTRQTAGFGEITYDLTKKLEVLTGGRYFRYTQEARESGKGIVVGLPYSDNFLGKGDGFNPKVGLSYKPSVDNLLFANIARGFRIGGAGVRVGALCGREVTDLGLSTGKATPFTPDHLWNYELGTKNSWANGKVVVDASIYYIDWKSFQANVRLSCGTNVYFNAGDAESRGAELEVFLRPAAGWQITGSVSYAHATLVTLSGGQARVLGAREGDDIPRVPKLRAFLGVSDEAALTQSLDGFFSIGISHIGERENTFSSSPGAYRLPGYTTGDLRVGLRHGPWELSAYANNLWNEKGITISAPYAFQTQSLYHGGLITEEWTIRPLTIGLTIRRSL